MGVVAFSGDGGDESDNDDAEELHGDDVLDEWTWDEDGRGLMEVEVEVWKNEWKYGRMMAVSLMMAGSRRSRACPA